MVSKKNKRNETTQLQPGQLNKIREEVKAEGLEFYLRAFKVKSANQLMLMIIFQLLFDLILHLNPGKRASLFRHSAIFDLAASDPTKEIEK